MNYKQWVEQEAIELKSDKCTMALDWNVWCCFQHDWTCSLGKDPYDGYRLWKLGDPDYRLNAREMSRRDADTRFWRCNREMVEQNTGNWFKRRWGMLRADVRYVGVRIGAVT